MALLSKSLDLLFKNYLLIDDHYKNVTVFIFHTGDFNGSDIEGWKRRYPPETNDTIQLINLLNTPYWKLPSWLNEGDLPKWRNPEFDIGYRHMIRWYAIRMWDYFSEINKMVGTRYKYIMRMDEESFFHSPIRYDFFHHMSERGYDYSFRTCSYEMNAVQQIFHNYTKHARRKYGEEWHKNRHFTGSHCGFYNNWFIGNLQFFKTPEVQHLLRFYDNESYMYRDRLNDLVIQTSVVYALCKTERIHRYLDFSYEHFTLDKDGCPKWGVLSTGYRDKNAEDLVKNFVKMLEEANCFVDPSSSKRSVPGLHISRDHVRDLSPSYNHLRPNQRNMTVLSIKAGKIDLPNRGDKSGR
mmetsp:Transcript_9596/g.10653  ORF Transcript_9596/g.10653 Transcript_9596/m.10653 type:complete len:353 (+) Transcript_9596:334-1392(+)|eukprot:CAMPEP_0194136268 /NCGR_PEP_ID=MMETSP0152-20130528/6296_1 /TAXON_ID=1049557 /ORGANISM="Thalassiothrix antarctica, Strain L6-D1" /LENGTH=352 /DNA_ID=CAMNT_0038832857 /DNA_START=291 /DNA_END=1349 /DNA_ORIENTATION=+